MSKLASSSASEASDQGRCSSQGAVNSRGPAPIRTSLALTPLSLRRSTTGSTTLRSSVVERLPIHPIVTTSRSPCFRVGWGLGSTQEGITSTRRAC